MTSENENIVEALKQKFIASMVWKSRAVDLFNFDEVKTLVLGNLNGFSGLVVEALDQKDASRNREVEEKNGWKKIAQEQAEMVSTLKANLKLCVEALSDMFETFDENGNQNDQYPRWEERASMVCMNAREALEAINEKN